ncbi:unnamed protein product [Clonostachys rosea f. rosea IK726]|jgi:hypothetical protein|uniref:CHK kinase-like domain-containing protein n=2 Tax=Bionectria ochroleuca TaxID=29856 RepID=A0A0B7JMJ4_BIOOC|nr:unnamed protein product [Clonostachys rosea f. rosea IK726]
MASTKNLPLVPDDVTKAWLTEVLGLKIKTAELTHAIHGTASKLFFTLAYEDSEEAVEKPELICVKGGLNPGLTPSIRLLLTNLFRREVLFFNDVAPKVAKMDLVHCWWAGENDLQGIVIMEDLRKKNLKFGTTAEPWGPDLVKSGLGQLAILHATTWGQGQEEYSWLSPHYDQSVLGMIPAINYNDFVLDPERPQLPEHLQRQDRVEAFIKKYFAARNPKFRSLIHGDCHVHNTTISPKGTAAFIDWQLIGGGSCFHDVAYFMNSAMDIEVRRAHENELLDHYFEELHKHGGPKLSRDEEDAMIEFRKSQLAGFGMILATTQMQPIEVLRLLITRFVAGIEDHQAVQLVESL